MCAVARAGSVVRALPVEMVSYGIRSGCLVARHLGSVLDPREPRRFPFAPRGTSSTVSVGRKQADEGPLMIVGIGRGQGRGRRGADGLLGFRRRILLGAYHLLHVFAQTSPSTGDPIAVFAQVVWSQHPGFPLRLP